MEPIAHNPYLIAALCCLVSFAISGIPFGKIIAKRFAKVDLQQVGSGNIGTTNALRAGGPKVAILTLACDVLKGVVCVRASLAVLGAWCFPQAGAATVFLSPGGQLDYLIALVCLACVLGHMFSPYLGFHGGKSIAVGVGVLFGLAWPLALIHLGIFIVLVAITKFVSVGSIATAALVGVTVSLYFPSATLAFKLIMAALGLLVVWAHRGNIRKLRGGVESKLSFTKRVDKLDGQA